MNIIVSRFELYPVNPAPTCVVVGFTVTHNGCSLYKESLVNLADADGKTQAEVAQLAWTPVAAEVEAWCAQCACETIVGKPFVPLLPPISEGPAPPPADPDPHTVA